MAGRTDNIKTRLAFEGEQEYKAACGEINGSLKLLSSELKVTTAEYANNAQSVEALRARQEVLQKVFDEQTAKVKATEKALQSMKDAQGDDSDGAKRLETALNKAKAEMLNTQNEIDRLSEKMEQAGKSSGTFGDKFSSAMSGLGSGIATGAKATGAALAGMTAATVGAAAGLGKVVESSVSSADELQKLSDQTGFSAESLQKMEYVGSAVGVSIDTMTGAQVKLTKAMSGAQSGTGAAAEAFQQLGISVTDSSGHLRSSNDVFNEAIDKLGGVQNATERDALSMQIFGKSAMELNPLIKAGGDGIAAMSEEAEKNGAIMSNEAVAGLDNFGDSADALKLAAKGMAGTFAASLLPGLNQAVSLVGNLSIALNTALKTGDFSQFGAALSDGISTAVNDLSGLAGKMVPVVTKVLSGLVGALAQAVPTVLPALTDGVVQLINAGAQILQQNGPLLIKAGATAIITLVKGFAQAVPGIISTAMQMVVTLANAITLQLPTLVPVAVNAVLTVVEGIVNNLPQLIGAAINMVIALVQGLMNALPTLVAEVPKIIVGIIDGLLGALPQLIEAAPQIIVSLITGIIEAIPQLIIMAPQIIMGIIEGLIKAVPALLTIGPKILKGLWDGLSSQNWGEIGSNILKGIINGFFQINDWIKSMIEKAGESVVGGFKSFFGIHSPSTLMQDEIGVNLGLGISQGIQKTDFMAGVPAMVSAAKNRINTAVAGMAADIQVNANASGDSGAANGGKSIVQNFYGDIHANSDGTKAATMQQLRFLTAM